MVNAGLGLAKDAVRPGWALISHFKENLGVANEGKERGKVPRHGVAGSGERQFGESW